MTTEQALQPSDGILNQNEAAYLYSFTRTDLEEIQITNSPERKLSTATIPASLRFKRITNPDGSTVFRIQTRNIFLPLHSSSSEAEIQTRKLFLLLNSVAEEIGAKIIVYLSPQEDSYCTVPNIIRDVATELCNSSERFELYETTEEVEGSFRHQVKAFCKDILFEENINIVTLEGTNRPLELVSLEDLIEAMKRLGIRGAQRCLVFDLDGVFNANRAQDILTSRLEIEALEILSRLSAVLTEADIIILTSRPTRETSLMSPKKWIDRLSKRLSGNGENLKVKSLPLIASYKPMLESLFEQTTPLRVVITDAGKSAAERYLLVPFRREGLRNLYYTINHLLDLLSGRNKALYIFDSDENGRNHFEKVLKSGKVRYYSIESRALWPHIVYPLTRALKYMAGNIILHLDKATTLLQ